MPVYQVRVRAELTEHDEELVKASEQLVGFTRVVKIDHFTSREVSGIQEILDHLKAEGINETDVLSIIAIDEDNYNSDQLGDDWESE